VHSAQINARTDVADHRALRRPSRAAPIGCQITMLVVRKFLLVECLFVRKFLLAGADLTIVHHVVCKFLLVECLFVSKFLLAGADVTIAHHVVRKFLLIECLFVRKFLLAGARVTTAMLCRRTLYVRVVHDNQSKRLRVDEVARHDSFFELSYS
jgi:hypothetical protein